MSSTRRNEAYNQAVRKRPRKNRDFPIPDKKMANELFICIFELFQHREQPMIELGNMTDSEKETVRMHLVKAISNLRSVSYTQIYDDYSREITSGVTIFRIELLPQLMTLVTKSKQATTRMALILIDVYGRSKTRVYINTYQGDPLDYVGKNERRLHLLSIDDRSDDGPAWEDDSYWERPKGPMPPYPHRTHPEGHFWWTPNVEEWENDITKLKNEYALDN